jgi:prevent-host-death family protein
METVSSTEAQNSLGDLLERVAKGGRVLITRYGRRQAVILSAEEYDALQAGEEVDLAALEREFEEAVARMQTPEHGRAVEALFGMSGDKLGEAAVARSKTGRDGR